MIDPADPVQMRFVNVMELAVTQLRLIAPALLLLAGLSASPPCRAEGSIAHDSENNHNGMSWNAGSTRRADEIALRACGNDDCHIVERFSSACGAVAKSRAGAGWAVRDSLRAAERAATSQCERYGRDCDIVVSHCDE